MSSPGKTTSNYAALVAAQIALIYIFFITGIHAWHSDHRHLYGNASGGFIQERARVGASFVNLDKDLLGRDGIHDGFVQGTTNGHTGLADVNRIAAEEVQHPTVQCLNWEPLTLCAQKSSLACLDNGKNHLVLSCFHDTCGNFTPWSACISNVQFRFRPDCKGHIVEYQNCVGNSLNDERLARRLALEKERMETLKREAELVRQKLARQAEEDRKAIEQRDAEDRRRREEINRLLRERVQREAAERARKEKEAAEELKRKQEEEERRKLEEEERERAKKLAEAAENAQREKEAAEELKRKQEEEERRRLEEEERERAKKLAEAAERAQREKEAAEELKRKQEEEERAQREKRKLKEIEDSTLILEEGMEQNEPEPEVENVQPQEQEELTPLGDEEQQQLQEASVETPVLPPAVEETIAAPVNELPQQQVAAVGEGQTENEETQHETKDEKSHYNARSMTKQASVGLAAIASAFVGTYIYTKGSRRVQNLGADDAGFDDGDYNLQDEEADLEAKIQLEDNFWGENDDA